MSAPRVVLCGATGRTGNAVAHGLAARSDVELVACVAPSVASAAPTRSLPVGVAAFASLGAALDVVAGHGAAAPVVIDLTHAGPARQHLELALERRCHAVLGSTGVPDDEIRALGARFADAGLGLLQVPNFSLGAALLVRACGELARHLPDVEIVEVHHAGKRDSPSGTAVHTARTIAAARRGAGLEATATTEPAGATASRGESVDGVAVHALRLPGATAHQEVVFGAPGEVLTIRHSAIDRSCYGAGAALAAIRVQGVQGHVVGLENVL